MISMGIIDSGFTTKPGFGRSFYPDGSSQEQSDSHHCNHGSVIASFIAQAGVELYSAKVFHDKLVTTPRQIANALEYLIDQRVMLIHMSLGMHSDHLNIRDICRRYLDFGGMIVASAPAMSTQPVYPAAYSGVIQVLSDGRCSEESFTLLCESPLRLGASPLSPDPIVRGSSVAAARISGMIGLELSKGISPEHIIESLIYRGRG